MSLVVSRAEMRDAERQAFARGVDAWELMLDAGRQMAGAIRQFFPQSGRCLVFAGKGNNAGDALAAAQRLQSAGWNVELRLIFPPEEMSDLARRALDLLDSELEDGAEPESGNLIVLDGLLGLGATGPLRTPIREAVQEVNRLRHEEAAVVFALDLPSGLEGDSDEWVVADHTLTVGFAKERLLADEATDCVGRLSVLPLADLEEPEGGGKMRARVSTGRDLRGLLPPRKFDQHKGQSGRIGLVAGSVGTTGAAVLAATGALRAGAGLVTVFCPPEVWSILAIKMPPEVMIRPWREMVDLAKEKFDVLAIGPGLAVEWADDVRKLVAASELPLVLDAGALSIFSQDQRFVRPANSITLITPHPGEMERIDPRRNRSRAQWAQEFVTAHRDLTLLLKGARTIVAAFAQPLSYNSTGHPGMATGGMGDTLTGVCAALLGQKLTAYDAARLGAWVCARAAEIAVWEKGSSQESLLPSDVDLQLGRAFKDCRSGVF